MSSRNNLYYFIDATFDDEKDILDILEEPDFSGDISIIYTRRPSPLKSLAREGQDVKVLLCKRSDTHELAGFGVCAIRDFYIAGESTKVGYLSGLRIKKSFRKKFVPLTKAYETLGNWIAEQGVTWVYTTVLEENEQVIKMFSRRRKSMPNYNHLDRYIVYSPTVRLKRRTYDDCNVRVIKEDELDVLADFLSREGKKSDFYPVITLEDLKGNTYLELDYKQFYVVVSDSDEIRACAYIQDRHDDKQHILHSYQGKYKSLKHLGPILPFFGYPRLPKEGRALKYFNISYLRVENQNMDMADFFIRELANYNKEYDYLLLGLVEKDPMNEVMQNLSKVTYKSRLYRVDYIKTDESEEMEEGLRNLYVECGLL